MNWNERLLYPARSRGYKQGKKRKKEKKGKSKKGKKGNETLTMTQRLADYTNIFMTATPDRHDTKKTKKTQNACCQLAGRDA